jgi:hypothetical protein
MTTTYKLTYSLGTISINQFAMNTQTSLSLPGYDCQVFGQQVDQNQLSLLENFAGPGAPQRPIPGQLWFDNAQQLLKLNRVVGTVPSWEVISAAGTNTYIQFNDEWSFGATANFTYQKDISQLTVVGSANITNQINSNTIISNTIISNTIIGNVTANNINIDSITSNVVNATDINTGNIFVNIGTITTLNAVDINATDINSTNVFTNLTDSNIGNIRIINSTTVNATTVAATNVNTDVVTATTANIDIINATTVNGTLGTAAQPNITSVGTLTNLTVAGNTTTGGVKTDNYFYANGDPVSFNGTYTNSNVAAYLPTYTGNISANIANVDTFNVTGDAVIGGNLTVDGTTVYVNVTDLQIEDPIISAGGGPNGAPLTTNDGKDRGAVLNYYTTSPQSAFIGWDNSTGYMTIANAVTVAGDIVTVSNYGTLRAGTAILDGVVTPTLSTGAAATPGTITGTWTLTAGSTLEATYADLGEKYVADKHYEPGTVVEFGGSHEVTIAEDGTRRVAGVVSTNPAYVMNTGCRGEHVVILALQGRVPCRVRGRIRKGDMMISGGDGYARPSIDPSLGSIIGKSLEDFDGIGVIEIAVGRL